MRAAYDYSFETNWEFEADIRQVWSYIGGVEYGAWWPGVRTELVHKSPSPFGIGNKYKFDIRTKLPYTLTFVAEVAARRVPESLAIRATGDLEGRGAWTLEQAGDVAQVRYVWQVNVTKPWMRMLGPALRPLFIWNHDQVMREGAKGLANALGTKLRKSDKLRMQPPRLDQTTR
ncbi:polyketide cyclase [Cohnella sp. AR92]|uniref:polyketide cyclase n=1 Tax=Cohnella sp. AR92 TaxID=648716 RepID=UPI000F8D9ED3|nr:polyketide cyclase [Cohnella sp. AR92]RUS45712.1 polyketide cyclase [Cohnella sp. AR92]